MQLVLEEYLIQNLHRVKTLLKIFLRNPLNRMAKTEEIVGAVVYLASACSTYTNGHNLIVDGGMSSW